MYIITTLLSLLLITSSNILVGMESGRVKASEWIQQDDLTDSQKNKIGTIKIRHAKCYEAVFFNNENKQIGSSWYRCNDASKTGWIGDLQIIDGERSKGYGSRLLAYVYQHLRDKGCKKISGELPPSNSNPRLVTFFTRHGAKVTNKMLEFTIHQSKL